MSGEHTYDYSVVRVVPRLELVEQINAGVILSCEGLGYLDERI